MMMDFAAAAREATRGSLRSSRAAPAGPRPKSFSLGAFNRAQVKDDGREERAKAVEDSLAMSRTRSAAPVTNRDYGVGEVPALSLGFKRE